MMRGEIWWGDFGPPFGSEAGFRRPVLIVQDDAFNVSRIGTTIVVPLTTNLALAEAPGNVLLERDKTGLSKDSVATVSQISVIDKARLVEKVRKIGPRHFDKVERGIRTVLGLEGA